MVWFRDSEILHEAIVQSIDSHSVTVLLLENKSCSGCQAEGVCGMSGKPGKEICIDGFYNVQPGNRVNVLMKQSAGFLALFLGYILPLFVFLFFIILLNLVSVGELASGLLALSALLPYYLVLALFRNSISRKFSFTLKT
jgi:sigma-E factor negative regulatory protein RseC